MVIVRSGKTGVLAIRSTGLQEVQRTDSRAHDPLIHTLQRARERSILFIRNAEAHDRPACACARGSNLDGILTV